MKNEAKNVEALNIRELLDRILFLARELPIEKRNEIVDHILEYGSKKIQCGMDIVRRV